jgi:hypothetical protein
MDAPREFDTFDAALIEGDGTRSRLELLIWTHLLRNPGSTGAEIRAVAQEQGVGGDVNLVLYRALERGEVTRTRSRTPRWSIAPGQHALGPAPDGSTPEQVVGVYLSVTGSDWSAAQVQAALQSDRIIRMTAFSPDELATSLSAVAASTAEDELWDSWFDRASRVRSSSIIV